MSPVFASRRRAEQFASMIDTSATGPRDAELLEFLAIVSSLQAIPATEPLAVPREDFTTDLRARLLDAADELLGAAPASRLALPRNARRDRRIAAAIGGIAVVGAGTSMAVAAQSALPGEVLYPLKRAIEDGQTRLDSDPQTRGPALLDLATSRLSELQELQRRGDLRDRDVDVSSSFVAFGAQASGAADDILDRYEESGEDQLIEQLRDFTGTSIDALAELEPLVPISARDDLQAAVELVREIDSRALRACPSCGGQGVGELPQVLLSSAATGRGVVVIPGATVDAWAPDDGSGSGGGRGNGNGNGNGNGSLTDPLVGGSGGNGSNGGSGSDPLGDLTDPVTEGLTGSGDSPTSNGGVGETVEETTKKVKKTGRKVGDVVDDVIDDVIDPPLLGD